LAHATLAYSLWRQGMIFEATSQAETAVKLNPTSTVSLINLALMKQNANNYPEAISLYRRAATLAPDNWVPPLSISRCYMLGGDQAKGLKALHIMSKQTKRSFDWYYMIAKTCLEIEEVQLAETATTKAIRAATTQKQRAASENLRLLTLLRSNEFDKAKSLKDQVFHLNHPKEGELFVRTAATLLPATDPAAGKELLNCAIENLTAVQDGDALLRLGRIFEDKAADQTCDNTRRASWLESAQVAFARAIVLSPKAVGYHLALAGALSSMGHWSDAAEEMQKNMASDQLDLISPFLITKIAGPEASDQEHPSSLKLSLVRFKIHGLTCSCHLSKIHGALRHFNNVVFISTPPQKPYSGLMLVDQSPTPVKEMLDTCSQNIFPARSDSKPVAPKVSLEMVSEEALTTIDATLKIAQDVRFGPILSFPKTFTEYFNRFKEVAPIMPVGDSSTAADIQTASSWNAPL